tara:strand:- start:14 stop:523 length:510 start_codon:yes stop_codon:yes gene_type:complete
MFGGSALTLDVGVTNNTVQPWTAGDIVQVDLTQAVPVGATESTSDGFDAVQCGSAVGSVGNYSVTGVVLAPAGLSIPAGEDCIIRIMGIAHVKGVAGAFTTGQLCTPTTALVPIAPPGAAIDLTIDASVAPALGAIAAADLTPKCVCLETNGANPAGGLIKVWMKGLPL